VFRFPTFVQPRSEPLSNQYPGTDADQVSGPDYDAELHPNSHCFSLAFSNEFPSIYGVWHVDSFIGLHSLGDANCLADAEQITSPDSDAELHPESLWLSHELSSNHGVWNRDHVDIANGFRFGYSLRDAICDPNKHRQSDAITH